MNSFDIIEDFIAVEQERQIVDEIQSAMNRKPVLHGNGRSRILRYGWDYEGNELTEGYPAWLPFVPQTDSVTVNEYPTGRFISPHIDSLKFDDAIRILSLGVAAEMLFISPCGQELKFTLPRRSLATMQGELRKTWKHATLPTVEGVRYSIVYRRKL